MLTVLRFGAAVKVPSPLPRSTVTYDRSILFNARSAIPSLLKSATTIEVGNRPTVALVVAVKVLSPFPRRIVKVS
jgi:hypothetical protein